MFDSQGTWCIRGTITTVAGTPKTAVQYAASSTNTAEILYFSCSQSGSTTSAMDQVQLIRMTAGSTVTAGIVGTSIFDYTHNSTGGVGFLGTLSGSATGVVATVEGTPGDIIHQMNFNVLGGYEWNCQPNMRVWVPVSGIISIKLKAVVALTYDCLLVLSESH